MNTTNSGGAFVITSSPSENWNTVSQGPYSLSFKELCINENSRELVNESMKQQETAWDNQADLLKRLEKI